MPARFTPALFDFLRDLRAHNDREWFQRNKVRYERDVRAPALLFFEDAGPARHRISRHVVADPRPVGGSMFRIELHLPQELQRSGALRGGLHGPLRRRVQDGESVRAVPGGGTGSSLVG